MQRAGHLRRSAMQTSIHVSWLCECEPARIVSHARQLTHPQSFVVVLKQYEYEYEFNEVSNNISTEI